MWAALSAQEGLTLAEAHRPTAVIVDLRSPLPPAHASSEPSSHAPSGRTPMAVVSGDYYPRPDPSASSRRSASTCSSSRSGSTSSSRSPGGSWRRRERAVPAGVPARAGRHHPRLVHAPGRPLHGRVPGAAGQVVAARHLPQPRSGHRGDAAAGAAHRGGRRDPVLGPAAAARAARGCRSTSSRARGRRLESPITGTGRHRPRCAASSRARRWRTCCRRSADPARAPRPRAAHRLRRRAVHAGVLRHRRRPLEQLRQDQGADVRAPRRLAPAVRAARRRGGRLPGGADRGRRGRGAGVRLVGRRAQPGRLPRSSRCPTPAGSSRSSARGCRRSTSAPARR